jgi:hypothetical protein
LKSESIARGIRARRRTIAVAGCLALLGAVLSGAPLALAAPTAAPNPTQLFGVHPVQEGSTTLPGGHFNFALLPGQRITDGIVVENLSNRVLTFHVYGADLITATGGGLAPAQPTAVKRAVGAWITVATPLMRVAAHAQFTDHFTLVVPALVSPGQHLGAVVVSADVGVTAEHTPIEARAALITVVSVPGVAHPSAVLSPLVGSTAVAGQIGFGITLSNNGNLLITYAGSVDVFDADGHRVVRLPVTPADAYVVPNGQARLAALWKHTASLSGTYRAHATVSVVVNGVVVATLHSQSLAMQFSSGPNMALVAGVGLALVLLLALAIWSARQALQRRRPSNHAPRGRRVTWPPPA